MIAADASHAAQLAAIHTACFPRGWSARACAALFSTPGTFGLLAPARGMILCRATLEQADLLTLAVLPAARRQGVARALLAAALQAAAQRGAARMFLEVGVGNQAATLLYEKAGFSTLSRRKAYYTGENGAPEDALLMSCALTAS